MSTTVAVEWNKHGGVVQAFVHFYLPTDVGLL